MLLRTNGWTDPFNQSASGWVATTGTAIDGTQTISYPTHAGIPGNVVESLRVGSGPLWAMRPHAGLLASTQYTAVFDVVTNFANAGVQVAVKPVGATSNTGQVLGTNVVVVPVGGTPGTPLRVISTFTTSATAPVAPHIGFLMRLASGGSLSAASGNYARVGNIALFQGAPPADLTPFSGATADTISRDYAWVGAANASASTESTWIDLSLIETSDPKPVRIIVADGAVADGATYRVVGVTADGSTWPVPGGVGVADGPITLIDNRAALNTPVTYQVLVDGAVAVESAPITVPDADRAIIQSLDGQTVCRFVLQSNRLPKTPVINATHFNVPRRHRGPSRFEPAGDGGGSLEIRTTIQGTEALWSLLHSGAPVVMRTDGTIRDLPAVDILSIDAAPSQMWDEVVGGQMSTDRVWAITYTLEDDPEPSTAVTVWTWDDFDAFWAGQTWDDFDAFFAGSDWTDFDTQAWE